MEEREPVKASSAVERIQAAGEAKDLVAVTVGPRFLELFSANLYGSPNKAFEELVANSWDAGAGSIHVYIPDNLSEPSAAIWILDDGVSMDLDGLKRLWAVAQSDKRDDPQPSRPQIGKFGIGKLATYILGDEVTYLCKADDGVIRAVTMDYRRIAAGDATALHREAVNLEVREIDEAALPEIAATFSGGDRFLELVRQSIPRLSADEDFEDEYGGAPIKAMPDGQQTWTLALLSSLKDEGRSIQRGRIRWMLRTALPLNDSVGIALNDEALVPSKVDRDFEDEWVLGEDIDIETIDIDEERTAAVQRHSTPIAHMTIEGIPGPVTGRFRLYSERLTGGKSDAIGASNGFFINVRGRVINYGNTDFGLDNLSHGAWAQFRATIRCDGLDSLLNVDRNALREGVELETFRAFLRALFNRARQKHNALASADWPSVGEILTGSWSAVPLNSLGAVVSDRLTSGMSLPSVFDDSAVKDPAEVLTTWEETLEDSPGDLISGLTHEELDPQHPVARYDIATRRFIINAAHPFVREHSGTHEEQVLVRELALVTFLADNRMLDLGLDDGFYEETSRYRDELLRLMAQLRRRTGPEIADLLQRSTTNPRGLEKAVAEALRYLGFDVRELGGNGEPEGIARAPLLEPSPDSPPAYSFTYDAKSTAKTNRRVSNKDVGAGRLARHRDEFQCDHALVVAPDFERGAVTEECARSLVTPMRAESLARLLMLSAAAGTLDLAEARTLFELYDPDDVDAWVSAQTYAVQARSSSLPLDVFLDTIAEIGFDGPDVISTGVVADRIRSKGDEGLQPTRAQVRYLVAGLNVLLPSIIRVVQDDVFFSASPATIRQALMTQLGQLPESLRFGIDKELEGRTYS